MSAPSPNPSNQPLTPGAVQPSPTSMPPGWYPHPSGATRWWTGAAWSDHVAPVQAPPYGPQQGYPMPVQPNVRQARDRAQYNRQQTGHSLMKHILLGWVLGYVLTIYYAISPNHYFHA